MKPDICNLVHEVIKRFGENPIMMIINQKEITLKEIDSNFFVVSFLKKYDEIN